jgi:hypothetical protein
MLSLQQRHLAKIRGRCRHRATPKGRGSRACSPLAPMASSVAYGPTLLKKIVAGSLAWVCEKNGAKSAPSPTSFARPS